MSLSAGLEFGHHGLAVGLTIRELHDLTNEELHEFVIPVSIAGPLVGVLGNQFTHGVTQRARRELLETLLFAMSRGSPPWAKSSSSTVLA